MHVVLFRQHGDQLITKYKCDNHTGNRYNDRLGKILYHAVNAAIPALRCLPNLSSNLTGLFIDVVYIVVRLELTMPVRRFLIHSSIASNIRSMSHLPPASLS